jgi:hypothetical protein
MDGGGNWVACSWDDAGTGEFVKKTYPNGEGFPCRYGKPGDRLWVRETWATVNTYDHLKPIEISKGTKDWPHIWYGADPGTAGIHNTTNPFIGKTRPSIFMPRWASRINLEIVNVKVERLQDISEEDAIAEGIRPVTVIGGVMRRPMFEAPGVIATNIYGEHEDLRCDSAVEAYSELWNHINPDYWWRLNPWWVWVIEFKLVRQ